ncbi:hypothetical protein [Falsigemmobacter faecalis]|uniref:Uncharacterized protein n=1 Tax=Falsigemmobacter faecalis TaxID=2488730 RepID=A0A3P3D6U6_9RHOB|nr:hypothetical protein [Falsigemmobacter faecalis]RRH70100.1 hypothetical protein EG244_17530 [Falsigemmobacter faecalis]
MEWTTSAVFSCYSDEGERVSVIEQCRTGHAGGGPDQLQKRYVLGNGQEIWQLHGSSYLDPQTGREFIRVWRWPSGLKPAAEAS